MCQALKNSEIYVKKNGKLTCVFICLGDRINETLKNIMSPWVKKKKNKPETTDQKDSVCFRKCL